MHLPATSEHEFELAPAGTHLAVCYRIIDLGTQDSVFNTETKRQHKILIGWELPDEKMADGRPFSVSSRYTWSMHEKAALRRDLESWRGRKFLDSDFGHGGFDVRNIIGVGCLLTVVHAASKNGNGRIYANITSIAKLMKGMEVPPLVNPKAYLWINTERWDAEVFSKLSQNLQGIIMKSPEYAALVNDLGRGGEPTTEARDSHDEMADEIPF